MLSFVKGLDDLVTVSIIHLDYLRFLVLVNTYPFFTPNKRVYGMLSLSDMWDTYDK